MARGGIYKSEVLRARDKLLAMGRYPSLDAVRIELGNTGSKGTIHRYLKEIEEEEGRVTGTKVAVSDAIQDLVTRLAERLHEEADARVSDIEAKLKTQAAQQAEVLAAARAEAGDFRQQLESTQLTLTGERSRHAETAGQLQASRLEAAQLAQQVSDLQERLATEARLRESLEEKHVQARTALDHFRQAAKEQREREQRLNEQQMQFLQGELRAAQQALIAKQHDLTHAQQEGTRLVSELSLAERDLHQVRGEIRSRAGLKEHLAAVEREADGLRRRLAEEQTAVQAAAERETALTGRLGELDEALRQAQLELAAAKAALATQEQISEEIRAHFSRVRPKRRQLAVMASDIGPDGNDASHLGSLDEAQP